MFKTVSIIFTILIAGTLIYAATKPDNFRIERSANIKAPPENIFPLINDFQQWEAWSPWEKIDPNIKHAYSGAASGKGAVHEWSGNQDVGQGRMEIIESSSPARIAMKLDIIKPFESHNSVEFTLAPQGDTTIVTQAMYGPNPYVSKLMGLFFSMETMVGEKYEEGFVNLKAIVEK